MPNKIIVPTAKQSWFWTYDGKFFGGIFFSLLLVLSLWGIYCIFAFYLFGG